MEYRRKKVKYNKMCNEKKKREAERWEKEIRRLR